MDNVKFFNRLLRSVRRKSANTGARVHDPQTEKELSDHLGENLEWLQKIYADCSDVIFHDFFIGDRTRAVLIYIDGLSHMEEIDQHVLAPLQHDFPREHTLPNIRQKIAVTSIKPVKTVADVIGERIVGRFPGKIIGGAYWLFYLYLNVWDHRTGIRRICSRRLVFQHPAHRGVGQHGAGIRHSRTGRSGNCGEVCRSFPPRFFHSVFAHYCSDHSRSARGAYASGHGRRDHAFDRGFSCPANLVQRIAHRIVFAPLCIRSKESGKEHFVYLISGHPDAGCFQFGDAAAFGRFDRQLYVSLSDFGEVYQSGRVFHPSGSAVHGHLGVGRVCENLRILLRNRSWRRPMDEPVRLPADRVPARPSVNVVQHMGCAQLSEIDARDIHIRYFCNIGDVRDRSRTVALHGLGKKNGCMYEAIRQALFGGCFCWSLCSTSQAVPLACRQATALRYCPYKR